MSDAESIQADVLTDAQEQQLENQQYNDSELVWEYPNE